MAPDEDEQDAPADVSSSPEEDDASEEEEDMVSFPISAQGPLTTESSSEATQSTTDSTIEEPSGDGTKYEGDTKTTDP